MALPCICYSCSKYITLRSLDEPECLMAEDFDCEEIDCNECNFTCNSFTMKAETIGFDYYRVFLGQK